MTTLEFKININATIAKVWFELWDNDNYKKWTSAFCDGSYAETDWKEGNKIHFLAPNGDGMYSQIISAKENKEMIFKHIGEIKNKIELPIDDKVKSWSGAIESYTLEENNGITTVFVKMDIVDDYKEYFNEAFPKGLAIIKESAEHFQISVATQVKAKMKTVWDCWTKPEHIIHWNNASNDWHSPKAENHLQVGGKFSYRMEAKDGSFGFDFEGFYDEIIENELIKYHIIDGRKVTITFTENEGLITIIECFEAENENSYELQKNGWQAILNNFKKHTENLREVQ